MQMVILTEKGNNNHKNIEEKGMSDADNTTRTFQLVFSKVTLLIKHFL